MTSAKIKAVTNLFLSLLLVLAAALPLWAASPQVLHFYDSEAGNGNRNIEKHERNKIAVKMPRSYPVMLNSDLRRFSLASEFELQLPDRSPVTVVHDRKWIAEKGQMSWVGHVKGEKMLSRIVLTLGKKVAFGHIRLADGTRYLVRPENGRTMFVVDPYIGSEPGSCILPSASTADIVSPSSADDSTAYTAGAESVSVTTIDLMIVYTDALVASMDSAHPEDTLETWFAHLVALSNQAYEVSEVHQRLRLVHHQLIEDKIMCGGDDGPTGFDCYDAALDALTPDRLKNSTTYVNTIYPEVMAARDDYGADLVSLIWPFDTDLHGGICGLAWVNGSNGNGDNIADYAEKGYSIVGDGRDGGSYCLETTLAHELGHNMGCMHDRETAASTLFTGAYSYSYGYRVDGDFHTIMSYRGPDAATAHFEYISNPAVLCNGLPCGIDENDPLAANNSLSMNNTRQGVAGFRSTQIWGEASVSPTLYDYGTLIVDQSSDMVFQVTNSGSFQLVVEDIALTGLDAGSYILADNQCGPLALQPGDNCEVTVSFAPLAEGVLQTTLLVSTDDYDTPELSVSLTGLGEAHISEDVDFDRDVDGRDLALFVIFFQAATASAEFNQDTVLSELDIAAFAAAFVT